MRLYSWNVNGIRAAHRNGFLNWFEREKPDVLSLQEIKAHPDQLAGKLDGLLHPFGYHSVWFPAEKAGYSGTAIYTRHEPLDVRYGMGIAKFDSEGRVLVMEFKDFVLVNAYFPNSQREGARLPYKLEFCDAMLKFLESYRRKGKHVVLAGDYNIAHQAIDLKNPKSNEKNAGYLPEERAWMTRFLSHPYVDVFRHFMPEPGHYTWWSYRPGVRERNVGWRIDYHCVNREFMDRVEGAAHQCEVMGSDHCPVVLTLKK